MARRLAASVRFSSRLRRLAQGGARFFQNRNFMGVIAHCSRISWVCLLLLGSCHVDRPIHPLRLEGFPGAPVVDNLFPLRDGMAWTFEDRLDPDAEPLVLRLQKRPKQAFTLEGGRGEGKVEIAWKGGFLELRTEGRVFDRILKHPGKAGDTWEVGEAIFTVFGYDDVDVLGEERRALVVAADRRGRRELAWFVPDMGWVRIRTERRGKAVHDAFLVAYERGMN